MTTPSVPRCEFCGQSWGLFLSGPYRLSSIHDIEVSLLGWVCCPRCMAVGANGGALALAQRMRHRVGPGPSIGEVIARARAAQDQSGG